MIQTVFLWFYTRSLPVVFLLAGLATVCFLLANRRFSRTGGWKPALLILLFLWVAVIVFSTLVTRTAEPQSAAPLLTPFHSYLAVLRGETKEILRSNLMNVLLFYPAGLLLGGILSGCRRPWFCGLCAVIVCAALSTGIEFAQYRYCLGLAEVDDVMHNTLGAACGIVIGRGSYQNGTQKRKREA